MRYQVRVTREITLETTVIVTADNADMAADDAVTLARRMANDHYSNASTWTPAVDTRDRFQAKREDVHPAPLTARARD